MASSNPETLLASFNSIQWQGGSAGTAMQSLADGLIAALASAVAAASGSVRVAQTSSNANSTSSGGVTAGSVVKTIFESGLGLGSLARSLIGLFTGGGSDQPAPLVKYAAPARLGIESAWTASGLSGVDYDQSGTPRGYVNFQTAPLGMADGSSRAVNLGPATPPPTPAQITVNVQAMDARSLMDRSGDIAAAVRNAMLNLNPINDVISEL